MLTLDTKIDIIRNALNAITSFPVTLTHDEHNITIRIKLGFVKDVIMQYTFERFNKISCRAIIVDTIAELRRTVDVYTCSNANYFQVITQITSPEFKKLEKN